MEVTVSGIKETLKSLAQEGIRSAHRVLCDRGLPVKIGLYGHSLESSDYDAFREMVAFFISEGYRFSPIDSFLTDSHERCVYLSFDDNYKAWFDAIPLLEETDVTSTFFVNTICFRDQASSDDIAAYFERLDFDGDRTPLSTSELQALRSAGHTIGAHTHSHFCLTDLAVVDAQEEILRSQFELEDLLGEPVRHFSYPFGMRRHFSEDLRDWCMSVGFDSVSNAIPCQLHAGHEVSGMNRTLWDFRSSLERNVANFRIDARLFGQLTGRSAVG